MGRVPARKGAYEPLVFIIVGLWRSGNTIICLIEQNDTFARYWLDPFDARLEEPALSLWRSARRAGASPSTRVGLAHRTRCRSLRSRSRVRDTQRHFPSARMYLSFPVDQMADCDTNFQVWLEDKCEESGQSGCNMIVEYMDSLLWQTVHRSHSKHLCKIVPVWNRAPLFSCNNRS
jgi:hypothetical protein